MHDGKKVDVVAQATKFGFLYVFDRETGKPLWPIEERPVPKSDMPNESSWPTQPVPTAPPPFARQKFTVDDINPYLDPAEKARIRDIILKASNEGIYTPPAYNRQTIEVPGENGGANRAALPRSSRGDVRQDVRRANDPQYDRSCSGSTLEHHLRNI